MSKDLGIDLSQGDEASEPVPRDKYAETLVGVSLADLIDEVEDQHERLFGEQEAAGGEAATEPQDADSDADKDHTDGILEDGEFVFEGALAPALPDTDEDEHIEAEPDEPEASSAPSSESDATAQRAAETTEQVSQITQDLESRLRQCIEYERLRAQEQIEATTERLRQAAIEAVKKNTASVRMRLEAKYAEKEKALRKDFEKLMKLANKIARQKAQIQQAKKQLEAKLKAADQLHWQVNEIRSALDQHIDTLDGLDGDDDSPKTDT